MFRSAKIFDHVNMKRAGFGLGSSLDFSLSTVIEDIFQSSRSRFVLR